MEFTLSDPPAHGYEPGDIVSGEVKYNIASQQETILDVRLHLDGSVLVHPSKLKYEAHRSNMTILEESQTPFQGPFTLKRQLLVWPFTFVLPATALVGDIQVPLPPSMDHIFREGIQIRVEYNVTATMRVGSDLKFAKQASKIVLVKQPTDSTTLENSSYALSFPLVTLQTRGLSQRLRSRFRGSSKTSTDTDESPRYVTIEMALPLVLCANHHDTVKCSLSEVMETPSSPNDAVFVLEIADFALRRHVGWQDLLEDTRQIGTATMRPGIELNTDGQPITLPDTLGLYDFVKPREIPGSLTSYKSVIPAVSSEFRITVTVILKHKSTGRRMHSTANLPVAVVDSAVKRTTPPAYERLEATQGTIPPPYETEPSH